MLSWWLLGFKRSVKLKKGNGEVHSISSFPDASQTYKMAEWASVRGPAIVKGGSVSPHNPTTAETRAAALPSRGNISENAALESSLGLRLS